MSTEAATQILLDWWQAKRGDRAMPARTALDPCELKAILPNLILCDVRPGEGGAGHIFTYRLAGTEIDSRLGLHLTGRTVDEVPFGAAQASIQRQYEQAVREARPIFCSHAITIGDRFVEYDRLAVPLCDAAGNVTTLAVAVDFKCVYCIAQGRPPLCPGGNACDRGELCLMRALRT